LTNLVSNYLTNYVRHICRATECQIQKPTLQRACFVPTLRRASPQKRTANYITSLLDTRQSLPVIARYKQSLPRHCQIRSNPFLVITRYEAIPSRHCPIPSSPLSGTKQSLTVIARYEANPSSSLPDTKQSLPRHYQVRSNPFPSLPNPFLAIERNEAIPYRHCEVRSKPFPSLPDTKQTLPVIARNEAIPSPHCEERSNAFPSLRGTKQCLPVIARNDTILPILPNKTGSQRTASINNPTPMKSKTNTISLRANYQK